MNTKLSELVEGVGENLKTFRESYDGTFQKLADRVDTLEAVNDRPGLNDQGPQPARAEGA